MTDTLDFVKCPACGKEMKKVYIKSRDILLDVCTEGCGGVYFDNREFQMVDEKHEDADALFKELAGRKFIPVDETLVRTCPNCGNKMVKNYSSITKEIQVDDCYNCGAKFLDNSELEKIRAEYKNDKERAQAVIDYVENKYKSELEENRITGKKARFDVTNADRIAMFVRHFL